MKFPTGTVAPATVVLFTALVALTGAVVAVEFAAEVVVVAISADGIIDTRKRSATGRKRALNMTNNCER